MTVRRLSAVRLRAAILESEIRNPESEIFVVCHALYFGDKTITAARHGFDVTRLARVVAQGFAQHSDVERQIAFLDEPLLPDALHQFIFFNRPTGALDQHGERFENLRRDRNKLSVAQQNLFRRVEAKISEVVKVLCFRGHSFSNNFLLKISADSQDKDSDKS